MPKVVDHEERRRELAEAVWRVIERDGVHRVSVRAVAAASGWSTGAMRHYFATQDALLAFAMNLVADRVRDRLMAMDHDLPTRGLLRGIASELMPLDEARRTEAVVWIALLARAQVEPTLRRGEQEGRQALLSEVSRLLWRAAALGELAGDRNADLEAFRFLSLVDGVTLAAIMTGTQISDTTMLMTIDRHLDDLFAR